MLLENQYKVNDVIKFFIKTRPLQQWSVKRELLRRIKRRFDELGIEIPFPHRTVYLRAQDMEAPGDGGSEGSGASSFRSGRRRHSGRPGGRQHPSPPTQDPA